MAFLTDPAKPCDNKAKIYFKVGPGGCLQIQELKGGEWVDVVKFCTGDHELMGDVNTKGRDIPLPNENFDSKRPTVEFSMPDKDTPQNFFFGPRSQGGMADFGKGEAGGSTAQILQGQEEIKAMLKELLAR